MRKSIIVAAAQNGVIGAAGKLPWHLSDDLKRFKQLTMGHTLIMGRKTFESLPPKVRPLPGRRTLVMSRGDRDAERELERMGATAVYSSWDSAFYMAGQLEDHRDQVIGEDPVGEDEVFICGGGKVYEQALPLVDRVYLTVVERDFEGDTEFDFIGLAHADLEIGKLAYGNKLRLVSRERGEGELPHRFEIWDRVR